MSGEDANERFDEMRIMNHTKNLFIRFLPLVKSCKMILIGLILLENIV